MIEVLINKKLKAEKLARLLSFLHSLSDEICFSSYHTYSISEDTSIEILNEYKQRCKERHHQLKMWYERKEPFLMKGLSKIGVRTEEDFEDYKDKVFESEMMLCKKMDETLLLLQKENSQRDYKEVFPLLKDSFKAVETHMFDSVSVSILPLDYVIYKADETMLFEIMKMQSLHIPLFKNEEKKVVLLNPVFANKEEAFALINNTDGTLTMVISEDDYREFKKLKIRHKKEVVTNEEEQ